MEIEKLKEQAEKAKPHKYDEVWTLDLREHWAAKAEGREEPRWVLDKQRSGKKKRAYATLQLRNETIRASMDSAEVLAQRYKLTLSSVLRIMRHN